MRPAPASHLTSLTAGASATVPSADASSYGQILKSSAIVGGASAFTVAISVIRIKILALLLGPAGVGLVGLYSSILELTQSIAGMGINSSGVRQIARAAGTGDQEQISRTAAVLRWTALLLGVFGAVGLVAFARPIALLTFNNGTLAIPVALLSVAVFFRVVSDGQAALIQGTRRIADLAQIAVVSSLAGTAVGLLFVYVYGENGIVPMLLSIAGATLLCSWWYRRRIILPQAAADLSQVRREASALLKLGFAFMASAVLTTTAAYAIRTLLATGVGLEAAGLYQSAWALGGLYIGFILQAMGSDFYPRLTAVAERNEECNRLVNEQAQVGLLLAGPGVVGTLTLAPLVVAVFYSGKFGGAVEPLRWMCIGMALRVIAWPMGYIVLAKGARGVFLATELAASVVHVGLAVFLVRWFGVVGAAMAFGGLYLWHSVLIYAIVRRMSGFRWSEVNRKLGSVLMFSIVMVFCAFLSLPDTVAYTIGLVATVSTAAYSARALSSLVRFERLPAILQGMVLRLRFTDDRFTR